MKHEPNPDVTDTGGACQRVRSRLPELVDGGLAPLEEARDQGHLEACAACAAQAEDWRAFHGDLGTALGGPSLVPDGLVEALSGRLDDVQIAEPPRPPVVLRPLQSVVAAAASLVLLFGLEALGQAMDTGGEVRDLLLAPDLGIEAPFGAPSLDLPPLLPGMTGEPDGQGDPSDPGALDLGPAELLEVLR